MIQFFRMLRGSVILIEFDEDKSAKFRGCSARERDFGRYENDQNVKKIELYCGERNFGMFIKSAKRKILRMSRTGAQSLKIWGATGARPDPSTKSTLKAKSPLF